MDQLFILSPANSGGERAKLLFNPRARFDLAKKLQAGELLPLGEVFSFLSGLYFRGKYLYAQAYAKPPAGLSGAYVITSNSGLLPAAQPVSLEILRGFGSVPIDPKEENYSLPLKRDAQRLAQSAPNCRFILLGSIGTKKYVEILLDSFGERLFFPASFVGRGDMSRGGLLLRSAAEGEELEYIPVFGAVRHGKRPAKLLPRRWGYKKLTGKTVLPQAEVDPGPR
jgi:hypothetical protein